MPRDSRSTTRLAATAALIAAALAAVPQLASAIQNDPGPATQRPLSDFLDAQGTTSIFIPPLPDFIGWANNNPQTLFASVDNLGLAANYLASHRGPLLDTRVDGTVSERPLADGRAMVTVIVHTTNALTWVIALPANDFASDPPLFGYRGTDLLADPSLTPALSRAEMKVSFTNTAPGAPLPDLVNAFILGNALPGQELRTLGFNSSGDGPLRVAAGVPDGTPGQCNVIQTGLFMTHFKGATADGFPAERVDLRQAGGGPLSLRPATPSAPTATLPHPTWGRLKTLYR